MVTTTVAYTLIKLLVGRARPEWQLVSSPCCPRSPSRRGTRPRSTAFGGILIVLVVDARPRGNVRRLLYALILSVVVVCADRVLLGRHFPPT
jgi:membrane-associated phospholipid phosphatase